MFVQRTLKRVGVLLRRLLPQRRDLEARQECPHDEEAPEETGEELGAMANQGLTLDQYPDRSLGPHYDKRKISVEVAESGHITYAVRPFAR